VQDREMVEDLVAAVDLRARDRTLGGREGHDDGDQGMFHAAMALTMRRPWLSLCFLIAPAASCGYPDLPQLCYGTAALEICLASAPGGAQSLDRSMSPLDTDSSSLCGPTRSGGDRYCVIAGTDVTVETKLRATGHKPLVLIATGSITIPMTGGIDVGSHRTLTPEVGAGADPMDCKSPMAAPATQAGTGGGGAGGSFIGSGGAGGGGGGGSGATGGRPAAIAVAPMTAIRGGCQGQAGAGPSPGTGGHGGGAVFLFAAARIEVNGDVIAGGEGGGGGGSGSVDSGGGGGGAGGLIGLDAPSIHVVGQLVANGGGGGEGAGAQLAGNSVEGKPGDDSTTTPRACGGTGRTLTAGDGCAGSVGPDAQSACPTTDCLPSTNGSSGQTGGDGDTITGSGGGGGGGGGVGVIHAPASAELGAQVSPPATP
jgi:hypothetical protein